MRPRPSAGAPPSAQCAAPEELGAGPGAAEGLGGMVLGSRSLPGPATSSRPWSPRLRRSGSAPNAGAVPHVRRTTFVKKSPGRWRGWAASAGPQGHGGRGASPLWRALCEEDWRRSRPGAFGPRRARARAARRRQDWLEGRLGPRAAEACHRCCPRLVGRARAGTTASGRVRAALDDERPVVARRRGVSRGFQRGRPPAPIRRLARRR